MAQAHDIKLHVLPPSHPCKTAEQALAHKGLEFERIVLTPGPHVNEMQELYGEGNSTVPGMTLDGETVHGSVAILERLEELAPDPPLYPAEIAEAVREAERWGDAELQDLGRRLPFGAMHFRPESMGSMGGGGPLDPPGTDFAMKYIHQAWRYHGITCARLADDLAGLPAKIDHVDDLAARGIIGGESPTAADLQIGATVRVLLMVGDLLPLLAGRPAETVARTWFPQYEGEIPAGAFPAGWVPTAPKARA
ncbi:MAG: glutathione S-transferase [Thermoleophilaceae bacterium]|nr:glutathione S-transferase [Thermoleophilaceae bacterium]